MQLGELLHMSLSSVRALPASEITMWMAYFKLKNSEDDKDKSNLSEVDQLKMMMGGKKNGTDETR